MLTKIWTTAIVLSAAASLVAWVCVAAHARGIRPLRAIARFAQKLSLAGVVVFGLMAAPLYRAGSTKVGGGTNNVPPNLNHPLPHMQQGDILSQTGFTGLTGFVGMGNPVNPVQDPITSTNTTRTLTAEDFERGFVMARVGTGEEVDFSAPSNAVVCADWYSFGAAKDWIYVAKTNWMFKVDTNNVECLRVYSFGKIVPLVRETNGSIATNNWFAPFMASLGVVPEANWHLLGNGVESKVWHCITPDNALIVTWQNVLLDRDTGKPVSFQVKFFTDGRFIFRYDLSRLDGETVANFLAGASFAGNEWTTNSLPTNVTSMAFYPLSEDDAYDQDPDGDGILTIDELFVHYTDPHNADSDYDGLNDGEELLAYNSDPLDPNSISDAYCDGFAAKLGDLDPFSCPEGSTSTIYEHIFYTGTTNAPFAYPTSTVETAVLKIMVSGVGSGRLVVGDAVVPLVAPPQMRSGAQTNTLLLAVGKGVRKELWFDKPDGLDVAINSDDLLIGRMPTWYLPHGWIAFPHTDATQPCIHDLYAEFRWVSLVHGEEFPGLTATWESDSVNVEIWNDGIVSAEITGHFPKNASRVVTYTVDHPNRLNPTPKTFQQTVRFCPRLAESDLAEYGIEDEDAEPSGGWCMCGLGCDWCYGRCSGNCPCCMAQVLDETTEEAAAAEYARIASLQEESGILQLYGPSGRADSVLLQVPAGEPIHCCECPEHWQSNHVALAWRSQRLSVLDSSDADFVEAFENVQVRVLGTAPSPAVGADAVLFATNGTPSACRRYTVLGVRIEGNYGPSMETFNALSQSFGYPMTICTNFEMGAELTLRTDVLLSNGVFRLALENVTGRSEVWTAGCDNSAWGSEYGVVPPVKLLDSESSTERYFTMRQWRSLLAEYVNYGRALPLRVVSAESGHCDLCFSFVHDSGGRSVASAVRQRITSVKPPLLPDYDRGGKINAMDVSSYLDGKVFPFWVNNDTWRGDDAFEGVADHLAPPLLPSNDSDDVVNGRNDLVNFMPLALDLRQMRQAWGDSVSFEIVSPVHVAQSPRFALQNVSWNDVSTIVLSDTKTHEETWLHDSSLRRADGYGYPRSTTSEIPQSFLSASNGGRCVVTMEFPAPVSWVGVRAKRRAGGETLYEFRLPLCIKAIGHFIHWINLHPDPYSLPTIVDSPEAWPDGDERVHADAMVVFVHGDNVSDEEAWDWGVTAFKRLWRLGLDAGFAIVAWPGNEGQMWIPGAGYATPDYYKNAENAFNKAPVFASYCNALPGERKYYIAHSLGNMLVSAAAQDWGLEYERFLMLDAAVPIEAYDPSPETHAEVMTPNAWKPYERRVRPTCWYDLFPEGDGRRLLTWKGRFSNVTNTINYFSREEEVVNNGDGKRYNPLQRNFVWHNQEYRKGWCVSASHNEGGWVFNPTHDIEVPYTTTYGTIYVNEHLPPTSAAALPSDLIKTNSFFGPFSGSQIYESLDGALVANDYSYRAMLLTHAIPSESFAVGANPVPAWGSENVKGSRNIDMAKFRNGVEDLPEDKQKWVHSYFINRSLKRTGQLYKSMMEQIHGKKK